MRATLGQKGSFSSRYRVPRGHKSPLKALQRGLFVLFAQQDVRKRMRRCDSRLAFLSVHIVIAYQLHQLQFDLLQGPFPRVRGNLFRMRGMIDMPRSIPARAGEPCF